MNPAIYLSCLVVIVGSLVWTASAAPAQGSSEFNSELARLNNIYGDDSPDQFAKARNVPNLTNFYEKYSDQLQMTPEERLKADSALKQYKEQLANQPQVEGAPAQGFWGIFIPAIVEILKPFIKKAVGA